jgi:UrcA family protein
MDRSLYRHDTHPVDPNEMPVSAHRHHLTFLMSYPIWVQGKRARKSRSHVADAILFLASGRAAAQRATEPSDDMTVFAPYVITRKAGPRKIQPISVSRNVNFHDLDLTIPGDAAALEWRVKQAAQDVCRELDSRYGNGDAMRIAQGRFCAPNTSADALAEIQMPGQVKAIQTSLIIP